MKDDKVHVFLNRLGLWLSKYKKVALWCAFALSAGAAGVYYYVAYYRSSLTTQAYQKLSFAEEYLRLDSLDIALNGAGNNIGLLGVIRKYASTPAANLAHYYVGVVYLRKQKYTDAIPHLEAFTTKNAIAESRRLSALADAFAELAKLPQAHDYYLRAATAGAADPIWASDCLFKAARVIEDTQPEQAIDCYKRIKQRYPRSPIVPVVEKCLSRLGVFS